MDRFGDDIFAASRLTRNEDGRRRRRDLGDALIHVLHPLASAEQATESADSGCRRGPTRRHEWQHDDIVG